MLVPDKLYDGDDDGQKKTSGKNDEDTADIRHRQSVGVYLAFIIASTLPFISTERWRLPCLYHSVYLAFHIDKALASTLPFSSPSQTTAPSFSRHHRLKSVCSVWSSCSWRIALENRSRYGEPITTIALHLNHRYLTISFLIA